MTAIVRARTTPAPAPERPASVMPTDELQSRLQFANALSKAGGMFPKCYQNNPGAILALMSWAERHGKDIVSAGQGVYVTADGQLIVSADMRVELANDRGFDIVDVTPDDLRREQCTVEVTFPDGREARRITVRLEDIHESVKGPTKNNKPSAWMINPEDLLLRAAQRRADKRFCRTGAVLIDSGAEEWDDDETDPVEVINDGQPQPEPEESGSDDVVDAEIVDDDDEPTGDPVIDQLTAEPITEEQLRSVAKVGELLRAATGLGASVALVAEIVADQDLAQAVLAEVSK